MLGNWAHEKGFLPRVPTVAEIWHQAVLENVGSNQPVDYECPKLLPPVPEYKPDDRTPKDLLEARAYLDDKLNAPFDSMSEST